MLMHSYWFGFQPTGCESIDKILSAVCGAGKAFHHTEEWGEHYGGQPSQTDFIQNAAIEAAAECDRLKAVNADLLEALQDMVVQFECQTGTSAWAFESGEKAAHATLEAARAAIARAKDQ